MKIESPCLVVHNTPWPIDTILKIMEMYQEVIKLFCVSFCTTEQHVEWRVPGIAKENIDVDKFPVWFILHNPFSSNDYVMYLSTTV